MLTRVLQGCAFDFGWICVVPRTFGREAGGSVVGRVWALERDSGSGPAPFATRRALWRRAGDLRHAPRFIYRTGTCTLLVKYPLRELLAARLVVHQNKWTMVHDTPQKVGRLPLSAYLWREYVVACSIQCPSVETYCSALLLYTRRSSFKPQDSATLMVIWRILSPGCRIFARSAWHVNK